MLSGRITKSSRKTFANHYKMRAEQGSAANVIGARSFRHGSNTEIAAISDGFALKRGTYRRQGQKRRVKLSPRRVSPISESVPRGRHPVAAVSFRASFT